MIRTGIGVDTHAFGAGDGFFLGGIWISHDHGVKGHSDGDALIHAVVDALLGAAGMGDIGRHFPSSDPQWKDVRSSRFLEATAAMIAKQGGLIHHIDATVILQEPVIGESLPEMAVTMSAALGINADQVNIKATTSDLLGFTGRKEGLAALAVATVEL